MTKFKNTLNEGAVLHGTLYKYTIVKPEQQDGFGITYLATGEPVNPTAGNSEKPQKFIVREHFMYHCSERAENGSELAIDEFAASTVDDFQEVFKYTTTQIKKLNHDVPGLLRIVEDFEENGTYYYVTEYLEGPTLREYIEQNGPQAIQQARALLNNIFMAVRRFHTRHILHTALSPDSIIIEPQPDGSVRPVLMRLYTCKIFRASNEGKLQLPPLSCPDCYAPMEQYRELDKFNPATDVYSLGAILVFVLSGKEPPAADQIYDGVIMEMLPDTLPESFRHAIVKAMSPDYHDRYESVTIFNNVLLESLITDEDRIKAEKHNDPVQRRKRHWRSILIMLAIVGLVVALVVAVKLAIK